MANDQWRGLRRYDPSTGDDFSITAQQLVAIGKPHRSIREMLAAGERAGTPGRDGPPSF